MALKRVGHGPCGCCSGTSRERYERGGYQNGRWVPGWGTGSAARDRYCAPCWNTLGVIPNAPDPFSSENQDRSELGWKRLNAGV